MTGVSKCFNTGSFCIDEMRRMHFVHARVSVFSHDSLKADRTTELIRYKRGEDGRDVPVCSFFLCGNKERTKFHLTFKVKIPVTILDWSDVNSYFSCCSSFDQTRCFTADNITNQLRRSLGS